MIIRRIKQEAKKRQKRILFVDQDTPVLKACEVLSRKRYCVPVFVGADHTVQKLLSQKRVKIPRYEVISHKEHFRAFAEEYLRLRGQHTHLGEAKEAMMDPVYFAAMCLRKGLVDGVVSGYVSETKPFLPAFRVVGVHPKHKKASSFFLMVHEEQRRQFLFADCGLNIDPSSQGLVEIAVQTVESAKLFGMRPKVAMLSFSTRGSAEHDMVDKVSIAAGLLMKRHPELVSDGELQVDAALVPAIAKKKAPRSPVAGKANILIFPSLDAGNIGYKLVERLGGFRAFGPILQGLNKPMNDMSRGASVEDIVEIACITALQAK